MEVIFIDDEKLIKLLYFHCLLILINAFKAKSLYMAVSYSYHDLLINV